MTRTWLAISLLFTFRGMMFSLLLDKQNPEELFEAVSQCLLSAVDRDSASGWGAIVHVM